MGTATDAILAFGYDFGEGDVFDPETLDWLGEDDDLAGAIEARLLKVLTGFEVHPDDSETEPYGAWQAYFQRRGAAQDRLGVEVIVHCHIEHPCYLLATRHMSASRGYSEVVDPTSLAVWGDELDRLAAAVKALGVEPTVPPAWLLCSYWG